MKTLALLVLLAASPVALADDNLLQNGDFSSGIAHWEGDCHTPDAAPVDLGSTDASTVSGVIVKLRHGDWTKVTQDFTGKIGEYLLTITYSLSPDAKFSTDPDDYTNVPGKVGFNILRAFDSSPGNWNLIVTDIGAQRYTYWTIEPKVGAPGVQKITTRVQLDSDDTQEKGFCLIFPPGDGFITLQSITLVPKSVAAQ
jgi:hypothetical protein